MSLFQRPGHGEERRGETRRRVDARGLVLSDGQETRCLIVDMSESGLRIRLDRAIGLPPVIVIVDLVAGTACEAEVAWCRGQDLGLRCSIKVTPLTGLVPGRLMAARDAWQRHRPTG